jgi:hypothetical protein
MTAPGDPGIVRPTPSGPVFVPSRRPVIGEKCILYPTLGGDRYAVPLNAIAIGTRAVLEPIPGGRIAVARPSCSLPWRPGSSC